MAKVKIKVGDTVRVMMTGKDDCSHHEVGDTFKVAEIFSKIWLRDEVGRATGISSKYCKVVEASVINNYEIY